jgi:hypothetical protein
MTPTSKTERDARPTERLVDAAADEAKNVWSETRDSARSAVERRQKDAASGIGDLAGALRSSAQDLGSRNSDTMATLVRGAADRLEQLSGTLRNKDLDTLIRDAEAFARREPALFFGAAVAAGFLGLRLLKASRPQSADEPAPPSHLH